MKLSVFYNHIVKASEQSGLPLTDVLDKVYAYGIEAVELDLEEALTGTEAMKKGWMQRRSPWRRCMLF